MSSFTIHNKSPLFRLSVEKLLNNWTALELAVLNGQGGGYGKEIALWMRGAVEDFFYQNDDLMGDEVGEFISQIMNQELDTIVDDNSLEELGDALCAHFRLANNPASIPQLLQLHLALDSAAAAAKPPPKPVLVHDSSSDDEEAEVGDGEEAMETEENGGVGGAEGGGDHQTNGSTSISPAGPSTTQRTSEPDPEGWVTVRKSKKH